MVCEQFGFVEAYERNIVKLQYFLYVSKLSRPRTGVTFITDVSWTKTPTRMS